MLNYFKTIMDINLNFLNRLENKHNKKNMVYLYYYLNTFSIFFVIEKGRKIFFLSNNKWIIIHCFQIFGK